MHLITFFSLFILLSAIFIFSQADENTEEDTGTTHSSSSDYKKAAAKVWKENEDCHLCGMVKDSSEEDDGMVETAMVVNGTEVKNPGKEYPFIVSINRKGKFLCTGALITNRYILTAGHCLTKGDDSSQKMETKDLTVELAFDEKSGKTVKVSHIHINHNFHLSSTTFDHDIGLLKLEKEHKCSEISYPICVAEKERERIGKNLTIAGFGHHDNAKRNKKIKNIHLRTGKVIQVDSKECKKAGPNTGPNESILCAVSDDTKQITCEGDSGSPVFWKFGSVYYALGVTSAISGDGVCIPNAKSTFSKVFYYKDWIKEKVGTLPEPKHL